MGHRSLLVLLCLTTVCCMAASAGSWNDNTRYRDYDYNNGRYEDTAPRGRDGKRDDYIAQGAIGSSSHTYQSRVQCDDLCLNMCSATTVYLGEEAIPMYSCDKLKPPKTLKGNSFYLSLFIIGVIVVGILVLITMCFCCSYCCRNPSSGESSRGSSKQALAHNEDGEFKEYLNGTGNGNGLSNGHHHNEDIGAMAMKREREFARRPRPVPQIV